VLAVLKQGFFSRNGFLSSPCQLELAEGFTIREVAVNDNCDLAGSGVHAADDSYERVNDVAGGFLLERRETRLDEDQ